MRFWSRFGIVAKNFAQRRILYVGFQCYTLIKPNFRILSKESLSVVRYFKPHPPLSSSGLEGAMILANTTTLEGLEPLIGAISTLALVPGTAANLLVCLYLLFLDPHRGLISRTLLLLYSTCNTVVCVQTTPLVAGSLSSLQLLQPGPCRYLLSLWSISNSLATFFLLALSLDLAVSLIYRTPLVSAIDIYRPNVLQIATQYCSPTSSSDRTRPDSCYLLHLPLHSPPPRDAPPP